jgi:hypothetical protein
VASDAKVSSMDRTPGHFRDNHVQYLLTHASEYTAKGVFAIVFSGGGQLARLFKAYLANPAALAH